MDSAGNLFIADTDNDRILRVAQGATQATIAVAEMGRDFLETAASRCARHSAHPTGVAVDAAGNLYIADFGNSRVRRVDTDGNITTIARFRVPRNLRRR